MKSTMATIERELNPFPYYEQMRRTNPVYYDPKRGGWNIFRYDDVQRALSDYSMFSSQFAGGSPSEDEPFAASVISTDPPRHRQLRSLVTQAFTPRSVDALAPRITQIVNEHLDRAAASGRMDIIADLAYPLPVIVIAELLGVPAEDREKFKRWSDFTVSNASFGTEVNYENFMGTESMEMGMYFMNMIEQRRQAPGDDLISGLLNAEIEGQRLSQIELLGFCVLLLVAGNETTTNLIGNAMLTFAENPLAWDQLRGQREILPQAIEEILRYRSPVQSMYRVTTADVEMSGQVIPGRSPVTVWIGSANHDEAAFPDPETLDLTRTPNKHLAFGNGIHYCLGAPLARLESRIALGALLERFKAFTLIPGVDLRRQPSTIVYGAKSIPILFEM